MIDRWTIDIVRNTSGYYDLYEWRMTASSVIVGDQETWWKPNLCLFTFYETIFYKKNNN